MWMALLGACALWITPEEQAIRLGLDTGPGDADADTDADTDADGDSDTDADTDRVEVETIDAYKFTGTKAHAQFTHDVDDGAVSRLVYCGPFGGSNDGHVSSVDDPREGGSYDVYSGGDLDGLPTRGGWFQDGVPFLLPVAPEYVPPDTALDYDFIIDARDVAFGCTSVVRYDRTRASGRLDVRFVFASATLTAQDAEGASTWVAASGYVEDAFAAAGITLTIHWENPRAGCDMVTVDSPSDAAELGTCVGEPGAREAVVVFVDRLGAEWVEDGETWGRTQAPGAPLIGAGATAIAVVDLDAAAGERNLARAIVHQLGHFLGLFDLMSTDGLLGDPIADDPECTYGGNLDVGDCQSGAADNAMWPFVSDSQAMAFSADQGWVMRRSAAVRP